VRPTRMWRRGPDSAEKPQRHSFALLHLAAAEAAVPAACRAMAAVLASPLLVPQRVERVALPLLLLGSIMFGHSSDGASTRRLSLDWRRERGSNPQGLAPRLFSRQVPSPTVGLSLQGGAGGGRSHKARRLARLATGCRRQL